MNLIHVFLGFVFLVLCRQMVIIPRFTSARLEKDLARIGIARQAGEKAESLLPRIGTVSGYSVHWGMGSAGSADRSYKIHARFGRPQDKEGKPAGILSARLSYEIDWMAWVSVYLELE